MSSFGTALLRVSSYLTVGVALSLETVGYDVLALNVTVTAPLQKAHVRGGGAGVRATCVVWSPRDTDKVRCCSTGLHHALWCHTRWDLQSVWRVPRVASGSRAPAAYSDEADSGSG